MSEFVIYIMAVFAILGALDRMIGNKLGLGAEFENGILAFGSLALSMLGIICLAPVLANLLKPVVVPVFDFLGADPGMFPGSILACDMGGASLAVEMSENPQAGLFGGVVIGSMLGATIVFSVPVALGILEKDDRKYLAKGVLAGIVTIPIGAFVGGILAGFPIGMLAKNLLPILIFALLIAVGLWKAENAMIVGFTVFGRGITIVITIGLVCAIVETLTGFVIIPGMAPLSEGYEVVGSIAIILAGAFPLIYTITKVFRKPLMRFGHLLGINETAAAGLIASLANSIPMFGMLNEMDERGKVINVAFAVSAAFVFGDHLGFTAGFAPDMLVPMIIAKLTGGIWAIVVALILTRSGSHE